MRAEFTRGVHKVILSSSIGNSCSDRKDTESNYYVNNELVSRKVVSLIDALSFACMVTSGGFQEGKCLQNYIDQTTKMKEAIRALG